MRIIGIDPGLAHMGLADVDMHREVGGVWMRLRGARVVETKPSDRKLGIRKSDDNMRRARAIASALDEWCRPAGDRPAPALLVYEAQSFGMKGSVAARQAGTAFGIIASIAQVRNIPLLCVTPADIKRSLCPGTTKATKDDVILVVERLWPNVVWPSRQPLWEHQADAIAAAWTVRDDELVRAILTAELAQVFTG